MILILVLTAAVCADLVVTLVSHALTARRLDVMQHDINALLVRGLPQGIGGRAAPTAQDLQDARLRMGVQGPARNVPDPSGLVQPGAPG